MMTSIQTVTIANNVHRSVLTTVNQQSEFVKEMNPFSRQVETTLPQGFGRYRKHNG